LSHLELNLRIRPPAAVIKVKSEMSGTS